MIRVERELNKAAYKLVTELMQLKKGEVVLIYGDTASDKRVIDAASKAAEVVGALPVKMWYETLPEVGAEPPKSVAVALKNCDAAIEFASKFLYITKAYEDAIKSGVRHLCLCGMGANMMIRCIGRVNTKNLQEFGDKLADLTRKSYRMKIATKLGTNLEYKMDQRPVFLDTGICNKPGQEAFLGGQISWAPVEESINGSVIIDGSLWPPAELGKLSSPVKLLIEKGKIVNFEGKKECKIFSKWLAIFNDKNMYNVAHICYGFNPKARLTGNILEDERVFGCVEIGFGSQGMSFIGKAGYAKSHSDGVILNPSIWLDNLQIEKDGEYIHPELANLAKKLLTE